MQVYDVNKKGRNTTYSISNYNGPISSSVGIVVGIIALLISIGIGIFYLMSYSQYFKTKDYIETDATIIEVYKKDNIDFWTLQYVVNGSLYTKNDLLALEGNVGDKVKIYYNPNDYMNIIWGDRKPSIIILLIALFFCLWGGTAIWLNVRRILHFFKPNEYESVDDSVSVGLGTGPLSDLDDLNNSNDIPEGHSKGIRF